MHWPVEVQQPFGQLVALQAPVPWQAPLEHCEPEGQAAQAAPLLPQAPAFCWAKAKQVVALAQQPVQLAGPQAWQMPLTQLWPAGQAAQAAPPAPQAAGPCAGQLDAASRRAAAAAGAVPHTAAWQVPSTQVLPPVQAVHLSPSLPQAVLLVPFWQAPAQVQQPAQFAEQGVACGSCWSRRRGQHQEQCRADQRSQYCGRVAADSRNTCHLHAILGGWYRGGVRGRNISRRPFPATRRAGRCCAVAAATLLLVSLAQLQERDQRRRVVGIDLERRLELLAACCVLPRAR